MRSGGGTAGGGSQAIQGGGFAWGGGMYNQAAQGHAPQGQFNYGYDQASRGYSNMESQQLNQLFQMLGQQPGADQRQLSSLFNLLLGY